MTECVFKWAKQGQWMLGVNTPGDIGDEVWSAFMDELGADDYRAYIGCSIGVLEVSSAQRKEAAIALRHNKVRVAVITDDVLVRGVVTAAGWLGANVKSFAWRDLDRALDRLDLLDEKEHIIPVLDRLREEVLAEAAERKRKRRESLKTQD